MIIVDLNFHLGWIECYLVDWCIYILLCLWEHFQILLGIVTWHNQWFNPFVNSNLETIELWGTMEGRVSLKKWVSKYVLWGYLGLGLFLLPFVYFLTTMDFSPASIMCSWYHDVLVISPKQRIKWTHWNDESKSVFPQVIPLVYLSEWWKSD